MIETTVASVVLVALAGTAAWIGPAQLRGIVRSHEETVAERIALARLEELRIPGRRARAGEVDGPAERRALPGVRVEERVAPAAPGLVRVRVEIAWDAADGGRAVRTWETLFAEGSPR
jgi:hypothetical protein